MGLILKFLYMSGGAHSEEGGGRGGPEKGQFYGF